MTIRLYSPARMSDDGREHNALALARAWHGCKRGAGGEESIQIIVEQFSWGGRLWVQQSTTRRSRSTGVANPTARLGMKAAPREVAPCSTRIDFSGIVYLTQVSCPSYAVFMPIISLSFLCTISAKYASPFCSNTSRQDVCRPSTS